MSGGKRKTNFYVQYHSQTTGIVDLYRFTAGITKINNELYLFSITESSFLRWISKDSTVSFRYNLIEMI